MQITQLYWIIVNNTCFFFPGEIHHAVNLSKPRIIFTSQANFDKVVNVRKQNKFIGTLVTYDDIVECRGENVISYQELIGNGRTSFSFECDAQNMQDNVLMILCSSGTTGLPKGVQVTQYGLIVAESQH